MAMIEFDENGNVKRPKRHDFRFLSKKTEIANTQREFEDKLKSTSNQTIPVTIVWHGGSTEANVYYSANYDFWFYFEKLEEGVPIPRYWNAFGLGKPKANAKIHVDVEINFPLEITTQSESDFRIAGVLVEQESKEIWVYHTGRLSGKKFEDFWKNYIGASRRFSDKYLAEIGNIDSKDFVNNIKNFVSDVARIKKLG